MYKNPKNVTNWGQKLDKFCHNTYKMWQTEDKICHNKITISVRYVINTLMYQTIVTNLSHRGQNCDKTLTFTNRVVVRFLACVKNFVTSLYRLSRVCPHFVTPQNPVISTFVRVLTPNVTKFPKLLTIYLFFLKKFC